MSNIFQELNDMYMEIEKNFNEIEYRTCKDFGKIIELMEQIDELSKWMMLKKKYYVFLEDEEERIKHLENEITDMVAQIVKMTYIYNIDMKRDTRRNKELIK